jgi:hypothetical protein
MFERCHLNFGVAFLFSVTSGRCRNNFLEQVTPTSSFLRFIFPFSYHLFYNLSFCHNLGSYNKYLNKYTWKQINNSEFVLHSGIEVSFLYKFTSLSFQAIVCSLIVFDMVQVFEDHDKHVPFYPAGANQSAFYTIKHTYLICFLESVPSKRVWTTVMQVTHFREVRVSNSGRTLTLLIMFLTVFKLHTVLLQLG